MPKKELDDELNKAESALSEWHSHDDLWIHKGLFRRGLLVVKQKTAKNCVPSNITIRSNGFFIKEQQFWFSLSEKEKLDNSNLPKQMPHTPSPTPNFGSVRRTRSVLKKLTDFAKIPFDEDSPFIFNSQRREEVFSPLVMDKHAIYVHAWFSKQGVHVDRTIEFSGFEQFVVAGCLFGSSCRGEDQHGVFFPIFKHDIQFFEGQKIENIVFVDKTNFYEKMLFKEFELLVEIICKFSAPNKPKRLLYHLPYYDYVLFGVELFIRGRITFEALGMLIDQIFLTKDKHIKKLQDICINSGIEAIIESPFYNLFVELSQDHPITAAKILEILQVSSEENVPETLRLENEKKMVQFCLKVLMQESNNPHFNGEHHRVWQELIKLTDPEKINNLEDVFKIANAAMIGVAALDKPNYKTCSLLPRSERQIQVAYNKYKTCPGVLNITFLDPVLAYNAKNGGPLYYFNCCDQTLTNMIKKRDILSSVHNNVKFFATKQSIAEDSIREERIEDILAKPNKSAKVLPNSYEPSISPRQNL